MPSRSYSRFAGYAALGAGVCLIVYSYAFIFMFFLKQSPVLGGYLYSLAQTLGGLLTAIALVAAYQRVRATDESFALLAFVFSVVGALGSAIHGGYDLGVFTNPPNTNPLEAANLPAPIDPRGLLTFGVASLGLFVLAWLMERSAQFPKYLAYVGYLAALLMLVLYLGRLIILDPSQPVILFTALFVGFIINPAFYIWLGLHLLRSK